MKCVRGTLIVGLIGVGCDQGLVSGEVWEVDLVGPLPTSKGGKRFILTMIDHFSRYSEVEVLEDKQASRVCEALEGKLLARHGVPKMILSDNGREFKNELIEEWCTKRGIGWKFGSPYAPTTTGAVERFNQTLLRKLRRLSGFGVKDWEECVEADWFACVISLSRPIGMTPFEVHHGQLPVWPLDEELGVARQEEWWDRVWRKSEREC